MKKYIYSIMLTLSLISPFSLQTRIDTPTQMPAPQDPSLANMDPFELLNNMSDEEFEAIIKEINDMSDTERKFYEDEGKKLFAKNGIDLDEMAKNMSVTPVKPAPIKQEKPASKPTPPAINSNVKEKDRVIRMIKSITDHLSSIRQKISSHEILTPYAASIGYELDLLTAYLNRMTYDKHFVHFTEKEFINLKNNLTNLESKLENLDYKFTTPDLSFKKNLNDKKTGSYQSKMNEATRYVQEFKNFMSNAFKEQVLLADIEMLFKKYDQEALKIKADMEDRQKKALEQSKKVSKGTHTIGTVRPHTPHYEAPRHNNPHGHPHHQAPAAQHHQPTQTGNRPKSSSQEQTGFKASSRTIGGSGKASGAESKDEAGKTRSGGDKEKTPEFVEIPLTFDERTKNVQKTYTQIPGLFSQYQDDITSLATTLSQNPPGAVTEKQTAALKEIAKKVDGAYKTTKKLLEDAKKEDDKKGIDTEESKIRHRLQSSFEGVKRGLDALITSLEPAITALVKPIAEEQTRQSVELFEALKTLSKDFATKLFKSRLF